MSTNPLPDFYTISRSHMYWGRKPFNGLQRILESLKPGEILLDPFCGGGTSMITALSRGARVIGSDLNPMAIFLSKVLIQPVSLFSLERVFAAISKNVAASILDRYAIKCPECKEETHFDYLQWNRQNGGDVPEAVKVTCIHCGISRLHPLTKDEAHRQRHLSQDKPQFWFPETRMRTQRKAHVGCFHELFTGRNLSALSELFDAISIISSPRSRQTLQYAFTAMLYSCSHMQMFSKKSPSSSRGWTAPRFYLPPVRMEKNVWKTFDVRFKNVLNCKAKLNSVLGALKISDSMESFEASQDNVYIQQADCMSLPFPQGVEVSHVLLDPPYNDDVDYLGFSEFWGSWLNMDFPIQASWRPGLLSMEDNAERLYNLLERVRRNTSPSCNVILAYGSKRRNAWPLVEQVILDAGYHIQGASPILFDNSQKRKSREFGETDLYLVLKRSAKAAVPLEKHIFPKGNSISALECLELTSFIRVSAYLLSLSHTKCFPSAERVRETASDLIRPALREKLSAIKKSEIIGWTSDNRTNQKAYNTLCLSLLSKILSMDGFAITSAQRDSFDVLDFSASPGLTNTPVPDGLEVGADFVASNNNGQRLIFCLFDRDREDSYRTIAERVLQEDKNEFRVSYFLVFPRHDDMVRHREVDYADHWPRGFLLSFAELLKRLTILCPQNYPQFSLFLQKSISDFRAKQNIGHFTAEVEDNRPVREGGDCKHFRIKFRAPELKFVVPGQFVMIDTLPTSERRKLENRKALHIRKYPHYAKIADLSQRSYLKRPFSIHRAFYKHFGFGYLKNILLPPNLAPVSHTVFPNRFEIFYKVLDDGIGTNELSKVKKGDKIEMVGPLGGITELAGLRQGFTDVHLVGGGVGMAPLIFFGQALKFYSFKLKAFIGIDRIETLLFSERFAPTFSEDPKNAYVYVENLLSIGLDLSDIYVSTEHDHRSSDTFSRLRPENCHVGFVAEQYAEYLESQKATSGILVIACGPQPMLRALEEIATKHNVPMKVLMEKRMACGIGVCMSCVCKTKKGNSTEYSRVCTDGPVFDSKDIVWD